MPLKSRFVSLLMVAIFAMPAATLPAQTAPQQERIAAAFVLALGRAPAAAEIAAEATADPLPVATLIAHHREQLLADAAAQRGVAIKAWQDAFGRTPGVTEIQDTSAVSGTYTEQMQRHVVWLTAHPAEYEQVLHRAYRLVLQREAYSLEVDYWRPRAPLPFALLLTCIEDWARRNQPGLMVTTGTPTASVNSRYLAVVRVSPAVAAEVRLAAGLAPAGDPALAIAAGRNLVAAGAEDITSNGGIHFVAAGAEDLIPAEARE